MSIFTANAKRAVHPSSKLPSLRWNVQGATTSHPRSFSQNDFISELSVILIFEYEFGQSNILKGSQDEFNPMQ